MYGDAITTIIRIKDRLQITAVTFDSLLTKLILSVTAQIESKTGRRFIQGTYTNELHDGADLYGTPRIALIAKNAPVQTITSIQYQTGTNSNPNWQTYSVDDYYVDYQRGIVHFNGRMPRGKQNVRITYLGGFSGYSIGVNNFWFFNITPTGTVNGINTTFTLPEAASQVIVYADGARLAASNVSFTAGTTSFTILNNLQPFSTIAVDYLRYNQTSDGSYYLPEDLVEVCEEVVVRLFKKRESEGRSREDFDNSRIMWNENVYTPENLATIKNYRRGYYL